MRHLAETRRIAVAVDSAGTIGHHSGHAPDNRAQLAGIRRGYRFDGIRARQVEERDFESFDLILAADRQNFEDLLMRCPHPHRHKLKMILDFGNTGELEVPDPYYGGAQGFEYVLDLLEQACNGLLDALEERQGAGATKPAY